MRRQTTSKFSKSGLVGIVACCLILTAVMLTQLSAASPSRIRGSLDRHSHKISPVLREEVRLAQAYPLHDTARPVIIRVTEEVFRQDERSREIFGESTANMLHSVHSYTTNLTAFQIEELLESDVVEYVTADPVLQTSAKWTKDSTGGSGGGKSDSDPATAQIESDMADLLKTIGADQIQVNGPVPTGNNIVAAVFDSGIGEHPDFGW